MAAEEKPLAEAGALWWPCPNCKSDNRDAVRWDGGTARWERSEDGTAHTYRYLMNWTCDNCKQNGQIVYRAR
ncbi:hypothetical protein ABH940_007080 [Streptacidiphilus sp. BW17]